MNFQVRLNEQESAIKALTETVNELQNILKGPSIENKLQSQLDQVIENQREKEEKKNNVILFNVPESEKSDP